MRKPRREFLWTGAACCGSLWSVFAAAQARHKGTGMPSPPPPAEASQTAAQSGASNPTRSSATAQHEREFRTTLAQLSEHVTQLKADVDQTQPGLFAVRYYKEAGEIERLAKQLKSLAKG
ncbi:MAG TPA: hypothetical protein VMT51_00885 [Dongiaceae bacterium]|nr:hypothetical protein [Dongiaceae bacterium]